MILQEEMLAEYGGAKSLTPESSTIIDTMSLAIIIEAKDEELADLRARLMDDGKLSFGTLRPGDQMATVIIRAMGIARLGDLEGALAELRLISKQEAAQDPMSIFALLVEGSILAVQDRGEEAYSAIAEAIKTAKAQDIGIQFDSVLELLKREDYHEIWPDELNPQKFKYFLKVYPKFEFDLNLSMENKPSGSNAVSIEQNISANVVISM